MLDDIKKRGQTRAAADRGWVDRFMEGRKRIEETVSERAALYRPLMEEFGRESGWTVSREPMAGVGDALRWSFHGKGKWECEGYAEVRADAGILRRFVVRTVVSGKVRKIASTHTFEWTRRGVDPDWVRQKLREVYAQSLGVGHSFLLAK